VDGINIPRSLGITGLDHLAMEKFLFCYELEFEV
jgi:hypothetical protein